MASSGGYAYLQPSMLGVCWLDKCFNRVDPKSDLGICDEHIEELREDSTASAS